MGSWKFELETVTPFGLKNIYTSQTAYNLTEAQPEFAGAVISDNFTIFWKMSENLAVDKYLLSYTLNNTNYTYYQFCKSARIVDNSSV